MSGLPDTIAAAVGAITAMGALGTAAFGLVDATKAFRGGVSNCGFGSILKSVAPFEGTLDNGSSVWRDTLRANWINGVPKEDQKAAAKNLIRLGLSSNNAPSLAAVAKVDPTALQQTIEKVEQNAGAAPGEQKGLSADDALLLGRLNAVVDAAMDAGFERADQQYRNASRILAGAFALALAVWAGKLLVDSQAVPGLSQTNWLPISLLVGLLATPVAPVAKDLASSLQTAAAAVKAVSV